MATHEERMITALETITAHVRNYSALTQRKRAVLAANLSVLAQRLGEDDPVVKCRNIDADGKTCNHPAKPADHPCPGFSREKCPDGYEPEIFCPTCGGRG